MSRFKYVFWALTILSLVILLASRFIRGGWEDWMWFSLAPCLLFFTLALVADIKTYLEFFTVKTTKNGLSMGLMILIVVAFLTCINFLAVRKNKSWDLSQGKLLSLSDESQTVMDSINEDLEFSIFYAGADENTMEAIQQQKAIIKDTLEKYVDASSKIKYRFINSYEEVSLAQEYLKENARLQGFQGFVDYQGRRQSVDRSFDEEAFTEAIIKVTRQETKRLYFVTGHQERDLNEAGTEGLQQFTEALESKGYEVESLALFESKAVPEDADVVLIVGPRRKFLEEEVGLIKNYLKSGGALFLAIDPGFDHGLANLTKPLGVEFNNNYIANPLSQLTGRSMVSANGALFDLDSEITKKFPNGQLVTNFDLASSLNKAQDSGLNVRELVQTPESSFVVNNLDQRVDPSQVQTSSYAIVMSSEGVYPGESSEAQFSAVIAGDSDFIANKDFSNGLNADLALNAVAYLSGDDDLISIKPKTPERTKLAVTQMTVNTVIVGSVAVPILLFIFATLVWIRRRGA